MFVILTQQYFGQIDKDLQDAILSNVINYYVFRVSEEDARALEGNLTIEMPTEVIETGKTKGLKEVDLRVKLMTELSPRECLVRIAAGGQVLPSFKARTLDAPVAVAKLDASQLVAVPTQKLPEKFHKQQKSSYGKLGVTLAGHPASRQTVLQNVAEVSSKPYNAPSGFVSGPTKDRHIQQHNDAAHVADQPVSGIQKLPASSAPTNLADLLALQSSSRFNVRKK